VQVGPGGRQAELAAGSVDEQERGDLADFGLDLDKTDQVGVQGLEDLIDTGGFPFLDEIDPGAWG
jgi:hypothetical protein